MVSLNGLSKELSDYIDAQIDNEVIMNRTDAIRQIIIEHREGVKKRGKK